jgi:hypothetical protein
MPLFSTLEREARFLPTGIPPLAPELQHDAPACLPVVLKPIPIFNCITAAELPQMP